MKKFFEGLNINPVFICLTVLLIMQLDWDWTNIKSFITGGVIVWSMMKK